VTKHILRQPDDKNKAASPIGFFPEANIHRLRGHAVIPVCGKEPVGPWKHAQNGPANEETLRKMFAKGGITGLAVILGSASGGLACRDFDVASAYYRWAGDHSDLASVLPTVATKRGHHVYFRAKVEAYEDLDDGEYRGDAGHYCLLPPSIHPDGGAYRYLIPFPDGPVPIIDPVAMGLRSEKRDIASDLLDQNDIGNSPRLHMPCVTCVSPGYSPESVEQAITSTLPTGYGQRNGMIFEFARRLKAIMPSATMSELKPTIQEWHRRAIPTIATKQWDVTWEDFQIAWGNVKHPYKNDIQSILDATLPTMHVDIGHHEGAAAKLLTVCAALQKHHGPGVAWPLSCRLSADLAGISYPRAARILRMLTKQEALILAKPGGPKGSGIAAEYLYVGCK
jgi:hypothetical protein